MRMRLPLRLFLSYAAVAVIGAVVAYLTVRLLAPALFDHQVNDWIFCASIEFGRVGIFVV